MDTNIFRQFQRALRAYQLYPSSSPVRLEAATALFGALAAPVRDHPDGFSLVFLEDGVYVEGRLVQASPSEESGPGAGNNLFNLGVREIRFLEGLSAPEVDRLLEPLARALQGLLNPIDEDLSVLLWEADLPHVWSLLYEERGPAAGEGNDALDDSSGPILDEYLDPRAGEGAGDSGGWTFRLSDEERLRIVSAYHREWEHDVPLKYARLLLEMLRLEGRSDECAVLRRVLENQLETEAAAGRFAVLHRIAECLEPERASSPGAGRALSEMASWFVSRASLARMLETRPARREDGEALRALIASFPAAPLPEGLAHCLASPESVSPEAAAALRERFEIDPELQSLCLRDSRRILRRPALDHMVPQGDDLRRVRECLRDRDPATRVAAVRALARAKEQTAAGLMDALFDGEISVRMAAAEALGRRGGRDGLDLLLRVMGSNGFEEREVRERSGVYRAAGILAPREVWPILARLAERRRPTWFGRRPEGMDPALEALAGLGAFVVAQARERWRRRPDLLAAFEGQLRRTSQTNGVEPGRSGKREAA